jgi:hypothetical protein
MIFIIIYYSKNDVCMNYSSFNINIINFKLIVKNILKKYQLTKYEVLIKDQIYEIYFH